MTDEMFIWIGFAAAVLLLVIEPRAAETGWFVLKIVLFLAIAAAMFVGVGIFGIFLIGAISSWLGGRSKK